MDRFAFTTLLAIGVAYFVMRRRNFDAFSVSFFGAFVYFFPGILGYGAYLTHGTQVATPIEGGTYRIMAAVLFAVILGAFIHDQYGSRKTPLGEYTASKADKLVLLFLLLLSVGGLLFAVEHVGIGAFSARKAEFNQDLGRAFVVYRNAALIGVIGSALIGEKKFLLTFLLLVCVELALGFRSFSFMAAAGVLWISLLRKGRLRVFSGGIRYAAAGLMLILATLAIKGYLGGIRSGNLDYLRQNTLSLDYVTYTLSKSEPFAIVNNLNIGYVYSYTQDLSDFLRSLLASIVPFFDVFGFQTASRDFAAQLFSDVEYGIAFSPWLDVYSAGGWLLLILFLAVYVFTLWFGNRLLRSRNWLVASAAVAALLGWGAYIERNAVAYQLTAIRRVILVAIVCYVLKRVLSHARRSRLAGAP